MILLCASYSTSIDCPNVINLALKLEIQIVQPTLWNELKADCCSSSGITCTSQRVTQISWYNMGLNGTINGTAIPSNVTYLALNDNSLFGSMPSSLPNALVKLYLYKNLLNGTITSILPNGLTDLFLNDNSLTGNIPSLPTSLTTLYLYGNTLNGSIPYTLPHGLIVLSVGKNNLVGNIPTPLPNGLTELSMFNNHLTGIIPTLLPVGLNTLILFNNRLIGDLPAFPSTLQYLEIGFPGYPGNHFTGIVRLNSPINLYINDNWITDIQIQNNTQIDPRNCDLSNNPLLENPHIYGLTMCIKNGLYSANSLPNTTSQISVYHATAGESQEMTLNIVVSENTQNPTNSDKFSTADAITWSVFTEFGTTIFSFQFKPKMFQISISLGMMIRVVISAMILAVVITKTPLKREFTTMMKKRTKKESTMSGDSIGV